MKPQYDLAMEDIWGGVSHWQAWSRLGWLEIKRRYRRTAIGPFWSAFQLSVMVFTVGFLWAALFNQPISRYMPYLCSGIVVWTFIGAIINEGGLVFTSSQALLTSLRIPKTMLVVSMVWRNVIVFLHNLAVYSVVALIWQVPVTWYTLLIVPGMIILAMNGVWIGLLVAVVATRLRDIPQLLSGLMQVFMFLTPVMWSQDVLKGHSAVTYLVNLNPLTHLLEIVREPMLGVAPSLLNWVVSISLIFVGGLVTVYVFSRFRQRIAFWL